MTHNVVEAQESTTGKSKIALGGPAGAVISTIAVSLNAEIEK
jgi:hypothetical protein